MDDPNREDDLIDVEDLGPEVAEVVNAFELILQLAIGRGLQRIEFDPSDLPRAWAEEDGEPLLLADHIRETHYRMLIARVKILAGLNLVEREAEQHGEFEFHPPDGGPAWTVHVTTRGAPAGEAATVPLSRPHSPPTLDPSES